jgi:hypothetical protein
LTAPTTEGVVGQAARDGTTTLYRAVKPDELADLQEVGPYRVPPGGAEGKRFFYTPEQVSNFAQLTGDQPYTTTSVEASAAEPMAGEAYAPLGEGQAVFFATPDVPSGPVTIFNYSVLP